MTRSKVPRREHGLGRLGVPMGLADLKAAEDDQRGKGCAATLHGFQVTRHVERRWGDASFGVAEHRDRVVTRKFRESLRSHCPHGVVEVLGEGDGGESQAERLHARPFH